MNHFFYKGRENILANKKLVDEYSRIETVKEHLSKVLETRNLSFLIGSGCSLGKGGIPTMAGLANKFYEPSAELLETMSPELKELILDVDMKTILTELGVDYTKDNFKYNIETFLGTLYSLRFFYKETSKEDDLINVDKVIEKTKLFILHQCLNEENKDKDKEILSSYKMFYRKLSFRDSNLPKPNIFTTNYDLYSEKAMDDLGVSYTNGFSGFIERYFNPSVFNYALAEQMDISSYKWNVIDSFIYLFKIHGSVNWIEEENKGKLFKVKEIQEATFENLKKDTNNFMIYPSPIKQNASLGSPYSDLFREFQKRMAQNQSTLITMGFSFSDEHINNLIYQALTIPTFRLIIFCSDKDLGNNIKKLLELGDPRIWIIGSDFLSDELEVFEEGKISLFKFKNIAKYLLPDLANMEIEEQNEKIIKTLIHKSFLKEVEGKVDRND